jgi:hypothetical protein
MKRHVWDCDNCGSKNVTTQEIWFWTDWEYDPGGGPSTRVNESLDLCHTCLNRLIKVLMKDLSEKYQKELFMRFGSKRLGV